jgi:hypothetical protein
LTHYLITFDLENRDRLSFNPQLIERLESSYFSSRHKSGSKMFGEPEGQLWSLICRLSSDN